MVIILFYCINIMSLTLIGKNEEYRYNKGIKCIISFIELLEDGKTVEEAASLLF